MIHELIIFVVVTVLWCCGIRQLTSKGYLLYFIRKPFDKTKNVEGVSENMSATLALNGVKQYVLPRWIIRPIAICITCMSSVHGILVFTILVCNGIIQFLITTFILGIVISAFIQTFIWSLYEKIIGHELE